MDRFRCRTKKIWMDCVKGDMSKKRVSAEDDRGKWKKDMKA